MGSIFHREGYVGSTLGGKKVPGTGDVVLRKERVADRYQG